MGDPESYFFAQRFELRLRDEIYLANAGTNTPTEAIQILDLFFSPFYTAKVLYHDISSPAAPAPASRVHSG